MNFTAMSINAEADYDYDNYDPAWYGGAEDPVPANTSWLDNYRPPRSARAMSAPQTVEATAPVDDAGRSAPVLYLVKNEPARRDMVPMPILQLVNDDNAHCFKSATREDIQGALAYGTQTIERACALMEGVLSQRESDVEISQIEPYVERLNVLMCRLKEQGREPSRSKLSFA